MIAKKKLEMTLNYVQQNKDQTETTHKTMGGGGETINNESTATEHGLNAQPMSLGRGGALKLILLPSILYSHALDSAVVKPEKNVKLAWRLPSLSNVSSQKNNYIYKDTVIKQRKVLATHRQLELKKNLS